MDFATATKLKELNKPLIGKKFIDCTIDDIIIYPNHEDAFRQFMSIYADTLDPDKAILLFTNYDLRVGIILDKGRIRTQGILLHNDIININDERLGAITEIP